MIPHYLRLIPGPLLFALAFALSFAAVHTGLPEGQSWSVAAVLSAVWAPALVSVLIYVICRRLAAHQDYRGSVLNTVYGPATLLRYGFSRNRVYVRPLNGMSGRWITLNEVVFRKDYVPAPEDRLFRPPTNEEWEEYWDDVVTNPAYCNTPGNIFYSGDD